MQPIRSVITILALWSVMTVFSPSAMAKIELVCIDSDGGLNLSRSGEVVLQAISNEKILLQKIFQDGNWMSKKKYVEFYCETPNGLPKYKLINCDSTEAEALPAGGCPVINERTIMLEAKHASLQPKKIIAYSQGYLPYYAITLTAPVADVLVKELRLDVALSGLDKDASTSVKIVSAGNTSEVLGQTLLGWKNNRAENGVVVTGFDKPILVAYGKPVTLNLQFKGLTETGTGGVEDNAVSVTINDIVQTPQHRFYFESKAQVNRYQQN